PPRRRPPRARRGGGCECTGQFRRTSLPWHSASTRRCAPAQAGAVAAGRERPTAPPGGARRGASSRGRFGHGLAPFTADEAGHEVEPRVAVDAHVLQVPLGVELAEAGGENRL